MSPYKEDSKAQNKINKLTANAVICALRSVFIVVRPRMQCNDYYERHIYAMFESTIQEDRALHPAVVRNIWPLTCQSKHKW